MNDPVVEIGGCKFVVPEYSIKSQRQITPALVRVAATVGDLANEKNFGELIDTIFLALTIEGANKITKDEFEALKMKPLQLAGDVLPVILVQAGLKKSDQFSTILPGGGKPQGGAGANPETPLSGETISTTSSPISSSPPDASGTPASDLPPAG